MTKKGIVVKRLGIVGLIGFLILFLQEARAGSLFNLGPTRNFTVLQVGSGTISQQVGTKGPHGGITGNVGITGNGQFQSNGSNVSGDLYLGNNASAQFTGSYNYDRPVTGMTHLGSGANLGTGSYSFNTVSDNPQALLNQARNNAINASTAANMLAASSSLSNINTSMTLYGTGVYYLNSLNLGSGSILTLSGNATDQFVFNISSTFILNGGKILLTGGLTEANVLFNFTGTSDVTVANSSVLHGIILALDARIQVSSLVIGEIIGGKDILINAGADVRSTAATIPETGESMMLLGLGLGVLVGFRFALLLFARAKAVQPIC